MSKKVLSKICLIPLLILTLLSCGQETPVQEQEETEPVQTLEPAEPKTQEELREAIERLGDGEQTLNQRRKYYEQLWAMDAFQETDYTALAQVYGDLGEWELQRDMLSKVLRLYPSREYARQLSAIVVQADDTDAELAGLAAGIMEAFNQKDAAAMQALKGQEQWKLSLQDGMSGIETRTRYCQGEDVLQITADGAYAEITWLGGNGRFCFYQGDENGAVLGETVLDNGTYNGPVTVSCSDGEGNVVRSYSGTLQNGICIDQITIVYQGVEYKGSLNADGTTAEEQYKTVAEKGGVVYAYTANGNSYLYQQDTTTEAFRMDAAYLGVPEYEEWR